MTQLLTAEQVAEQLAVTRHWVYDAVRLYGLPCIRCGRHIRFAQEDVDAWVQAQRTVDGKRATR